MSGRGYVKFSGTRYVCLAVGRSLACKYRRIISWNDFAWLFSRMRHFCHSSVAQIISRSYPRITCAKSSYFKLHLLVSLMFSFGECTLKNVKTSAPKALFLDSCIEILSFTAITFRVRNICCSSLKVYCIV